MFLIIINFAVEKHLNPLTFINMAKRVFMIAPFEAMTGNLSGDQDLQYAENNNPAYEAPNGTQYARNYRTRYVGARRGKDGLVYFQVKQTTATVLTQTSRRTMAILGVTAAIRSALMNGQSSTWSQVKNAFEYLKETGRLPEGQDTFNKWFNANIKQLLVYKRTTWSFTYASSSFTIHNPFDLASADALGIKSSIWLKFANIFAFYTAGTAVLYARFSIDGYNFIGFVDGDTGPEWGDIKSENFRNATYLNSLAAIDLTDSNVKYNGAVVYDPNGEEVPTTEAIIRDAKYTTADPNI